MPKTPPTSYSSDSTGGAASILTVSELTAQIKALIEKQFPFIWIQGEISNLRRPPSGHLYFTLKDQAAQISAVIFKGQQLHLKFRPEDGLSITGLGRISLYEPRGSYQIILEHIEPAGRGALQVAYEQLKARLAEQGYFDAERKQTLPFLPTHLSLITSPGGAVVHDMLKVIQRRFPGVTVDIVATRVQGVEAVSEIVSAIELVNRLGRSDLAVIARGGGSLEDLQPFNSEAVAMSIAGSKTPIVSAVGHETDYTIADFVADLRAPTPSAAIEMILPDKQALVRQLAMLTSKLNSNIKYYFNVINNKYKSILERIIHPRRQIQDLWMRLDDTSARLDRCIRQYWQTQSQQLAGYSQRLNGYAFELRLNNYKLKYEEHHNNLFKQFDLMLANLQKNITGLDAQLAALNPLAVLQRGYSIARTLPDRSVITAADQVKSGQNIEIVLARGMIECQVEGKSDHGQENL